MAMLNCRDPLFGGGSNPNTMAGAARLSDGPTTFMSMLKSKFSGSRGSTTEVSVTTRDQFGSYQVNIETFLSGFAQILIRFTYFLLI